MNNQIHLLKERGLVAQEAGGDLAEILAVPRKVYVGVEPTADSLHLGHLVPIILVRHLAEMGHEPYLLVGGATGLIGDPKETAERQLLDRDMVRTNARRLAAQMARLLGRDNVPVVDNADWLVGLDLVDFLRDVGKHFSVNQLIKRDIIKRRLDSEDNGISFTEFSYSLLQAYDYRHLHDAFGVNLQVGGSDQWANIVSGIDLIRRTRDGEAFGITTPIIVDKVSGKKFGKSEGNAVWLDPEKTSPFAFYQYWINVADENIEEYLKVFTFLSLEEIAEILSQHTANPAARAAQKALAEEATRLVHGAEAARTAERVSRALYEKGPVDLSASEWAMAIASAPSLRVSEHGATLGVVDALVAGGLASSKTEARRFVEGKAITADGATLGLDTVFRADPAHPVLVRRGNKVLILH